jgi:hypothetical protein
MEIKELNNSYAKWEYQPKDKLTQSPVYIFKIDGITYKSHFPFIYLNFGGLLMHYQAGLRSNLRKILVLKPLFHDSAINVCFYSFTSNYGGDEYNDSQTGTENAALVFPTVIATIEDFIRKKGNKIDLLLLAGRDESSKGSRNKLYRIMARQLQKKYGYQYQEIQDANMSLFAIDLSSIKESVMKENKPTPVKEETPGMVDTLTNQVKADPSKTVQATWDQVLQQMKPQTAEDYDKAVQQVQQTLGLGAENPSAKAMSQVSANGIQSQGNSLPQSSLDNITTQPVKPPSTMGTSTPQSVQAPQPTQAPSYPNYGAKMGNPMKQSYRSRNRPFNEEDIGRAKSTTKGEDQEYTGMTKLEQAQAMIKDLKKKKATDANILFSLVNRLFIDVETAQAILDKEIKKDEFPDKHDAITDLPQDGIMKDKPTNDISIKESKIICPKCGATGSAITTEPYGKCKCKKCGDEFPVNGSEEDTIKEEWEEDDDEEEEDDSKWTPAFSAKSNPKGKLLTNWNPGEESKKDKDIKEDSIYNHSHITTNNNYDYGSYDFYQVRDPYEFELNSTQLVARAMIVDQRYTYEMRFQVMKETDARFPQAWKFLLFHDIRHILKISVNLLNANTNYMKLSPDSAPIFNETRIAKVAALAFKSYIKLWGKQHFQIIVIETENPMRLIFNTLLAKELAKVSGIKINQNLSLEMTGKPLENTNVPGKPKLYTVLTNAAGGKIKEAIEEGIFTKGFKLPKNGIVIDYNNFSSSQEITQKFGNLFDITRELFLEIESVASYHNVSRIALLSIGGFPIDEHFRIREIEGILIAYNNIIIARIPNSNNERQYKNCFFYYDNYSTQLKEFYSIAKTVIEDIKNEKLHKKDLSLGAGEVSGLSFDEAQVDEDTESSAFMPSAPENVAGLVDLSTSRGHRKPIPFGGQTGDEINADARRHLKQMSGSLETQLESIQSLEEMG